MNAPTEQRLATTEAEIAHIDELTMHLIGGLVKIILADVADGEVVGIANGLDRTVVGDGLLATVTVTTLDKNRVTLNLLDIEKVESAFLEHRSAFVAAGLLDLTGSSTVH
ncbi:hypothetical protein [Burkholderia contaminans]|uniref:Uncharacterized protein n=1 Tax=Burkholderia contaminans TaxID=488447 RepID=A0A6P3BQ19_9BURK|nr:hypothetical protein [Burkholderia contaminans]VWD62347.1 hypothetical protein BCO71033_06746 [Burkholderia contaminans]